MRRVGGDQPPQPDRSGHSARDFHEGLTVSGTGIKDSAKAKDDILDEFPGGLAVEEEGYVVGIVCLTTGIPYLNIRGISDRAHGDKQKQDAATEEAEQSAAALAAAKLTVRIVELLSERL